MIKELFGSKTTEHNRISVFARAGDVNKDGVPDLVVGSPDNYRFSPIGTGVAWVISGDDWSILHTWYGEGEDDQKGTDDDRSIIAKYCFLGR